MRKFTNILSLVLLGIGTLLSQHSDAQSPRKISYQAVIRNSNNELVANQQVGMQIIIYQDLPEFNNGIYLEELTPTTNANGLVSIEIGGNLQFDTIDWAEGPYYLWVGIDPAGGANYTISGASQLLSVPYALYSDIADSAISVKEKDPLFVVHPSFAITSEQVLSWDNAYSWGDHNLAGYLDSVPGIRQALESDNDAGGVEGITGLAATSINTTGADPASSAILDVSSTSKGVLLPRMNLGEISSILDPEPGLLVMDTTAGSYNLMVYDGLEWIKIIKNSPAYGGLVLWNKLGSEEEVENSKYGPGGTITGSSYAFEPAHDGNGYVRKATGDNYVNFPGSILQNLKEMGTVELWVNPKVVKPVPFSYGVFAIVGDLFGTNSHVYIAWGDGVSGTGFYGTVNFDGTGHQTPFEATQFEAVIGVPFHVSLCWDVNGIEGSANTVRLYRDGELIGTSDATWDAQNTTTNYEGFNLGIGPDGNGYDKFIVDELKVWNFAKTDFTPFRGTYIAGDLKVGGNIHGNIQIDTIHVSQIAGLLGEGYTMRFPDILDNLGILEVDGIGSNHVVILNGPGYDVEAVENYNQYGERDDYAGRSMEHPLIFEADDTDPVWFGNMISWFNETNPATKNFSVIIPDVEGVESIRWNYSSFIPDGYEPGVDNRTRFRLANSKLPDVITDINLQLPDPFGNECSMNADSDPDELLFDGQKLGCPSLEVDTAGQVMTLTWDFKESTGIWARFNQYFQGYEPKFQVVATWQIPDYGLKQSTFDGCFPIHFEHLTGFGLDKKSVLRMKIWYVRMREA